MNREELLDLLAKSALDGGLGLFVGSGVSRALTIGTLVEAPTWEGLLRLAAKKLCLRYPEPIDSAGMSYPQIASHLVSQLESRDSKHSHPGAAHFNALLKFKAEVAWLCCFAAERSARDAYATALGLIRPAWVVTTNYDLLFDELLEDPNVLLPGQVMPTTRRGMPVYHIHGHRLAAESIIIAEEDYVDVLGPNRYGQLKLSLLFSESTTLVLGYSLGDINVLSAMKWAELHQRDRRVVQAVWCEDGIKNDEPYRGRHGEVILEIDSIQGLLSELADRTSHLQGRRDQIEEQLDELTTENALDRALRSSEERRMLLRTLRASNKRVLLTLGELLDPVWIEAREDSGWKHYDRFLNILLDAFEVWPTSADHPGVFSYLRGRLEQVAYYISLESPRPWATAFAASSTWKRRVSDLDPRTLNELEAVADNGYSALRNLFPSESEPKPAFGPEWSTVESDSPPALH